MKWFFFLLLLANIGLFVWIYPHLSDSKTGAVPAADIMSLTLLSELSKVSETVTDTTGPEAEIPVADVGADALIAGGEVVSNESQVNDPVEDELPESAFSTLEKELKALGEAVGFSKKEEVKQEVIEPEPILSCITIGPLAKRADADKLSLRLRIMGLLSNINSETTNDQEGYWVLVPPQRTRAEAVETVKLLQEAGITDLWRFTSGKLARAISLGLFRNEARAEIRRQSIADKGFNVEVRPRYRQNTNYWLSYSFTGETPVTGEKWAEIEAIYPDIEKRSVDCLEIATE